MCHALGGRGLDIAIEAGVDSIEHGCYLDEDREQLARMAAKRHLLRADDAGLRIPPQIAAAACQESARATSTSTTSLAIRRALEAGVKVVAGTDAGGHGHPANAGELDCLVRAGMTPMQAIQAATRGRPNAAAGRHELGTVEKGKFADLVVAAATRWRISASCSIRSASPSWSRAARSRRAGCITRSLSNGKHKETCA